MKTRLEVQAEDTWDLSPLFPSDKEWEEAFEKVEKALSGYDRFKGHLHESGQMLYQALKFDEDLSQEIEVLYVYAKQKSDENTADYRNQNLVSRARTLSFKAASLSSYLAPEILFMDVEHLKQLRSEEKALNHFNRMFEMILKKKSHTLSTEVEELLSKSFEVTEAPSQIFNMFNNADIKFPTITDEEGNEVTITHGNYMALLESRDRLIRKKAFEGVYHTYQKFENTLAAIFSANVKKDVFYARAKNYASSREWYLSENEIDEVVYDNLIEAVHDGLEHLHNYVALRKKILGLDEIHMYDLYVSIIDKPKIRYSFEQAKEIVLKGLEPLGLEYQEVLKEGFLNRWIDVYENEGKRSGAYSWGAYGTHPYVLLNYNGTLNHVFTLAHEMGHALHSYYSDRTQPYSYAGYKIFVAEVASTCNEALLIRDLLNTCQDRKERCYLINHFLESFRTTLYRQTMFAEFEQEVHKKVEEGQPLTANLLCDMYRQLNQLYFGPEMVVDGEINYEWSRIPHFYTPFYVYQYATGFSAAVAISSGILDGNEEVRKGYFEFLEGGCSMPPVELLKRCGIDMTTKEPIEQALLLFGRLLKEFEELCQSL